MRVLILLALCGALGVSSLEEDHNLHLRTGSVPIPLHPLRASDHAHKIAHLLAVDHAEPKQYAVHVDSSVSIVRDMDLAARLEQAAGTRVIHYLPTDNFLMLLSSEQVRQVASLPEVLSVVDFLPEYKVDPALTDSVHGLHMLSEVTPASSPARKQMASLRERLLGSSVETHLDMESLRRSKESLHPNVRVNGMRKIQASLLPNMVSAKHSALLVKDWTAAWQANYQQQRDDLVIYTATPNVVRLMVHEATMPAALEFLSKHPWVQWVEETPELRMMNDEAAPTLQTGTTSRTPDTNVKIWTKGIKGAGEIIGVGDSGLDSTNCFFSDSVAFSTVQCNSCKFSDFYTPQDTIKTTACAFAANNVCTVPSTHRKIASYWTFADNQDNFAGHGSHVCGTVAGDTSTAGLADFTGLAPSARIAFADLNNETRDGESSIVTPPDLENNYLPYSYYLGARINTNSWGGGTTYGADALQIDKFVYFHKDMLVLFAAGNDGPTSRTIGSQAQNKNGVAVGASRSSNAHAAAGGVAALAQSNENWRLLTHLNVLCTSSFYSRVPQGSSQTVYQYLSTSVTPSFTSQTEALNYYCLEVAKQPKDGFCCASTAGTLKSRNGRMRMMLSTFFSLSCCATDLGFNSAQSGSTNWNIAMVESFSSRGPTSDSRIKPDVVAPGSVTVSAFAEDRLNAPNRCGSDPGRDTYGLTSKQGTSMATPAVAGAAALVREYFRRGFGACGESTNSWSSSPFFISAALVKAVLIHSGVTPLQSHTGASLSVNSLNNAYVSGYGRVQLASALRFTGDTFNLTYFDAAAATNYSSLRVGNGVTKTFAVPVVTTAQPLVVTLTWTDPAGSLSAASQLVNDLDLKVTSPGGVETLGNHRFYTSRDTRNNVEQVIILTPVVGTYTVSVVGTRVLVGSPQDYALVITHGALTAFAPAQNPECATGPSTVPGPTVASTPTILSSSGDDFRFQVVTTQASKLYWVVVPWSVSAPATSADVKNGVDGTGSLVSSSNRGVITSPSCTGNPLRCTFTVVITGLDASQRWTVAYAAETDSGVLQVYPGALNYGYSNDDSSNSKPVSGGGIAAIVVVLVVVAIVAFAFVTYARRKPDSSCGRLYSRMCYRGSAAGGSVGAAGSPAGRQAPTYNPPPTAAYGNPQQGYPAYSQPPPAYAYPSGGAQPQPYVPGYGQPMYAQPQPPGYGQQPPVPQYYAGGYPGGGAPSGYPGAAYAAPQQPAYPYGNQPAYYAQQPEGAPSS